MKSCSILVVDDEPELRDLISRVLVDAGHRVTCAENGEQASRLISGEMFDVVLTDVIMPEKDGMQVITELRRKYPSVRVVVMSGGGHVPRDQYLKIAKGLGAHAVLEKPFDNIELRRAIESVLPTEG
jgi:CheY-like chemotaxis protein